jgi:hypothetical protein
MAQLATTFSSYDAAGIREDLSDLISNISPTDCPFMSNIGSESCSNTYFEWQTDSLAAAAQNHQIEGDDLGNTYTAVSATTRLGNYTSISRKEFLISGTEQQVNKAGRASELGYQATKKARELKRDIETNITANNAAVAGNDTTARETGGLSAWLKTNVSSSATNGVDPVWTSAPTGARSDGETRAFTETLLKSVVKKVWDSGGDPSILMVGSFNKQAASAFAGIAAQRFQASEGPSTIVAAADIYISDFGSISVVPNRFQPASAAYIIDPAAARVRHLRPYSIHEMAKTGDGEKRMLINECGLQVDNEAAHGIVADLTSS